MQTYYLDARDKNMWTDKQVTKDKTLVTRWMRQFAHTWRHFAFFVPWVSPKASASACACAYKCTEGGLCAIPLR